MKKISLKKYSLYFLFICTVLAACRIQADIRKVESDVILFDSASQIKEDTSILRIIKPYKEKMDSEMNEVLAYSEEPLVKNLPEGMLNNFVSDLTLTKANEYYKPVDGKQIDLCLLNYGGLRANLPKGNITRGKIFELMPFENVMVIITLSGEKTKQMFDYIAKTGGMPISGFSMGIKDTIAVNVNIGGEPFNFNINYKIVTSDYLANGGDKMYFFLNPLNIENTGIKIRDVIIEYLKEGKEKGYIIKTKLDKRIYYEK